MSKTVLQTEDQKKMKGYAQNAAIFITSSFATPSVVIKPLDFPALFAPASVPACAA